jgi:hypothetical protein
MIILQPPIESIERAYASWLGKTLPASERVDLADELFASDEIRSSAPADDGILAADSLSTDLTPDDTSDLPDFVADAIRRQVQTRLMESEPQSGDIVVLGPPAVDNASADPQQPVAIALDEAGEAGWTGWLVGSHIDYAGDRDLVLDSSLLEGSIDPAPLVGMVLCWDRVALRLPARVHVLHRLTSGAIDAIRALSSQAQPPEAAPAPGRMCIRELASQVVVTGTPYLRDDPRAGYLRLVRELARRISVPEHDDQGVLRRPDRGEPEA